MIKVGEIVELNDNKKYMVLNKINLHNINYVYLITMDKPVEILIATENSNKVEGYFRTAIYNEPFNYNLITSIGKIYENDLQNYEKAKESFNFVSCSGNGCFCFRM